LIRVGDDAQKDGQAAEAARLYRDAIRVQYPPEILRGHEAELLHRLTPREGGKIKSIRYRGVAPRPEHLLIDEERTKYREQICRGQDLYTWAQLAEVLRKLKRYADAYDAARAAVPAPGFDLGQTAWLAQHAAYAGEDDATAKLLTLALSHKECVGASIQSLYLPWAEPTFASLARTESGRSVATEICRRAKPFMRSQDSTKLCHKNPG
jgi:hypothetical protein